jgi:hypothetical protein
MHTLAAAPGCREELTQPVFKAMDVFEYPELHDESIAVNNFFRLLCKLMTTCGIKDFGLKACHSCHLQMPCNPAYAACTRCTPACTCCPAVGPSGSRVCKLS